MNCGIIKIMAQSIIIVLLSCLALSFGQDCTPVPEERGDVNVCGSWDVQYSINCARFPPIPGPQDGPGEAKHPSEEEINQILDAHNKYRAEVGAAAMNRLKWDEALYPLAAEAVKRCALQHTEQLYDPSGAKCARCGGTDYNSIGENLYMAYVDVPFTSAVDSWVKKEKACYPPGGAVEDDCTGECGHYTQVVWDTTKAIACAKGYCGERGVFIACNYGPAGNSKGQPGFKLGAAGSGCGSGAFGSKGGDNLCD